MINEVARPARPDQAGPSSKIDTRKSSTNIELTPSAVAGSGTGGANTNARAGLAARRHAARRLPPLSCGHSDPFDCLATVPPSQANTVGARSAWHHLRDHGLLDSDGWLAGVLAEGVTGE
jgi:hypothetical protein